MSTTITPIAEAHLVAAGILPEPPASAPDPAVQIAEQAAQIADLKARLDAQLVKGNNRPVELEDGEALSVKEAKARHDAMSIDLQLEILKSERFIAALADSAEASTPVAAQRPVLNRDEAEKLLGRNGWERLSNAEKAKVLDIRPQDVDKLNPRDYFGKGSSSLMAHTLSQSNPGLYKLVRTRAITLGIL
jgi:hypothetical protein